MKKEVAKRARNLSYEVDKVDRFIYFATNGTCKLMTKAKKIFLKTDSYTTPTLDIPRHVRDKILQVLKEYQKELEQELEDL